MNKNYDELQGVEFITNKVTTLNGEQVNKTGYIKKITIDDISGAPSLVIAQDNSTYLPEFIEVYCNQKETCKLSEWHLKSSQVPNYYFLDKVVYTLLPKSKTKYKVVEVKYFGEHGVVKCKEILHENGDESVYHPTFKSFGFDQVYIQDENNHNYYALDNIQSKIKYGYLHL